jgi:hypothetical protein
MQGNDEELAARTGNGGYLLPLFLIMSMAVVLGVVALTEWQTYWVVGIVFTLEVAMIGVSLVFLLPLLSDDEPTLQPEAHAVRTPTPTRVAVAPTEGWHQVLIIANHGLDDPALYDEVSDRGTRSQTEVMVIAPVLASSWLHGITGDIDTERRVAQERVDVGLQALLSKGVKANGHTVDGQPLTSLLDGLSEFPASEVVMLNGGEVGWSQASAFAEHVRTRFGLRVTEVNPSVGPLQAPVGRQLLLGDVGDRGRSSDQA